MSTTTEGQAVLDALPQPNVGIISMLLGSKRGPLVFLRSFPLKIEGASAPLEELTAKGYKRLGSSFEITVPEPLTRDAVEQPWGRTVVERILWCLERIEHRLLWGDEAAHPEEPNGLVKSLVPLLPGSTTAALAVAAKRSQVTLYASARMKRALRGSGIEVVVNPFLRQEVRPGFEVVLAHGEGTPGLQVQLAGPYLVDATWHPELGKVTAAVQFGVKVTIDQASWVALEVEAPDEFSEERPQAHGLQEMLTNAQTKAREALGIKTQESRIFDRNADGTVSVHPARQELAVSWPMPATPEALRAAKEWVVERLEEFEREAERSRS